jgi:hypothetical protein
MPDATYVAVNFGLVKRAMRLDHDGCVMQGRS